MSGGGRRTSSAHGRVRRTVAGVPIGLEREVSCLACLIAACAFCGVEMVQSVFGSVMCL